MAGTEIRLIGGLSVFVDGREAALPASRKTRALLACMALEPGQHRRAALCGLLWTEARDPRAALRWSLTKLRGVLGPDVIVATAEAVGLDAERVRTDVGELDALLTTAQTADLAELERFAERFEEPPLARLDARGSTELELWLESQQDRLRRLQQRLLATLSERLTADAALPFARQRVSLNPLSEAGNEALLRLIRQVSGRREAQATLERMRSRFRDAGLSDSGLLTAWRRLEPAGLASHPLEPAVDTQLTVPGKPSVAVLAFEPVEDSAAILAEGLAVDLTYKLARLKGLFVTARASALRFDLAHQDAATIGRSLGVRYLVHATVQQLTQRIRVTVDLIGSERAETVWAERFERALDDVFDLQDEMADAIVAALEPQIERAEQERARFLPTDHLGAWECYHRAMWHSFRFTRADNEEAFNLLERALRQDPDFARAYAGLSFNYFSRVFLDASADTASDLDLALDAARQSVSLQPRDALGHWSLGRALLLSREHDQALAAIDRALFNDPNYAQGHYARGFIETHAGMPDQAVTDLDMARRLSPFDPLLFAMEASRAINLAVSGRYPEAAEWAVRATTEPNAHFHIFAIAAACLQLAGQAEAAGRQVRRVLTVHPRYTVAVFERSFPHKSEQAGRVMSDALLTAGLRRG